MLVINDYLWNLLKCLLNSKFDKHFTDNLNVIKREIFKSS